MTLTTFILTFFVNQSYAMWRRWVVDRTLSCRGVRDLCFANDHTATEIQQATVQNRRCVRSIIPNMSVSAARCFCSAMCTGTPLVWLCPTRIFSPHRKEKKSRLAATCVRIAMHAEKHRQVTFSRLGNAFTASSLDQLFAVVVSSRCIYMYCST